MNDGTVTVMLAFIVCSTIIMLTMMLTYDNRDELDDDVWTEIDDDVEHVKGEWNPDPSFEAPPVPPLEPSPP